EDRAPRARRPIEARVPGGSRDLDVGIARELEVALLERRRSRAQLEDEQPVARGPRSEIRHDVGTRGPRPDLELGRRRTAGGFNGSELDAPVTGSQPRSEDLERVGSRRPVKPEADRGRA